MSPDIGGIKRAEQFQQAISKRLNRQLPLVFMEKYRNNGQVRGEKVAGNVTDKTVVIVDDLISTGSTLARACSSCRQAGAKKVLAVATHGLFSGEPDNTLQDEILQQIIVTNTVPPFRLMHTKLKEKVMVLNVASLFAETIKRIYKGESVAELLRD